MIHSLGPKTVGRLPTETEYPRVAIGLAEELIPDDLGGDDAVVDAISTLAQRERAVRKTRMHPDVGDASFVSPKVSAQA